MSPLAELFLQLTHAKPDEFTEGAARAWAQNLEAWLTHQIRYYCWDYLTAERMAVRIRDAEQKSR